MGKCLGSWCIALAVLVCSACEAERLPLTAPAPPSVPPAPPSAVSVRVEGRVIDAETEQPIPRATVSTVGVCYPGRCEAVEQPTSATADDNGMFVITANIPETWSQLQLRPDGVGYETGHGYVTPSSVAAAELRLLRTLTIRPGESIEMRVFLGSYVCGFESHLCRRVLLQSSPGEPMDLEVIPADAQRDVGLFAGPQAKHPLIVTSYPRRVTVSAGEVWIYSAGFERTGIPDVFDQQVRLIAHPR
jgi:hypothetical protein